MFNIQIVPLKFEDEHRKKKAVAKKMGGCAVHHAADFVGLSIREAAFLDLAMLKKSILEKLEQLFKYADDCDQIYDQDEMPVREVFKSAIEVTRRSDYELTNSEEMYNLLWLFFCINTAVRRHIEGNF